MQAFIIDQTIRFENYTDQLNWVNEENQKYILKQ